MAGSTEAASRVNFNPDWMGNAPKQKCPSFTSSQQQEKTSTNDTILAPPKLSKNRYGREELLALFSTDISAPTRLKDDFVDFFVNPSQQPICMQQLSEIEQQLLMHGGVNSSKVINVVNHAERFHGHPTSVAAPGQRWANLPGAPGKGFGRGAPDPQPQPPFYGARGRGASFVSGGNNGGEQKLGAAGFGRGRVDARGAPAGGRSVGGLVAESKDAAFQRNSRAQGLYGSGNTRDFPRQRIKSSNRTDELDDFDQTPTLDHSSVKYSTSSSAAAGSNNQQQGGSLPEWADVDIRATSVDTLTGTFDATGNFRRSDDPPKTAENRPTPLPPPLKYSDGEVRPISRRTPQTFAAAASATSTTAPPPAYVSGRSKAPTPSARPTSTVPAVANERAVAAATTTPLSSSKVAAISVDRLQKPTATPTGAERAINSMPPHPKNTSDETAARFRILHPEFPAEAPTPSVVTGRQGPVVKKAAEDAVLSSLHQQAENLVKSVCLDDNDPTISQSSTNNRAGSAQFFRKSSVASNSDPWYYIDPSNVIQGPFSSEMMATWFAAGYFNMQLKVGQSKDGNFILLGDMIKNQDTPPFMSHPLSSAANSQPSLVAESASSNVFNALNRSHHPPQQKHQVTIGSVAGLGATPVSSHPATDAHNLEMTAAYYGLTGAVHPSLSMGGAPHFGSNLIGSNGVNSNLMGAIPSSNANFTIQSLPYTAAAAYGAVPTMAPNGTTPFYRTTGGVAVNQSSNGFLNVTGGAPGYNAANSVPLNAPSGYQSGGQTSTIWDVYNNPSTNSSGSMNIVVSQQQPILNTTTQSTPQELEQKLKLMLEQLKQSDENRRKELAKQEEEKKRFDEERQHFANTLAMQKIERDAFEKERSLKETEKKLKAQLEAKSREKAWLEEAKRCENFSTAGQSAKGAQQIDSKREEAKIKEETRRRQQEEHQAAERKVLEEKERKQKEVEVRLRSAAEERQKRESAEQAMRMAEENQRRSDEEKKIRHLKEQKDKENLEVRKLEEERRRQIWQKLQQQQQQKNFAANSAPWSNVPETKSSSDDRSGQSLREIQLEEERQMAAERRQILELELTKKDTPTSAPPSSGAWGATNAAASKSLKWNQPSSTNLPQPALTSSSSSTPSAKNAWGPSAGRFLNCTSNSDSTATTGDGSDGFWDEEAPTPREDAKTAASNVKSVVFTNSRQGKKQQPGKPKSATPTKNARPDMKSTIDNNAVKRYLAAASQPADEFSTWCVKQVKKLNKEIDESEAAVFIEFLRNVPDLEVTDYVLGYIPDTQASKEFLKDYIERRTCANKTSSKSGFFLQVKYINPIRNISEKINARARLAANEWLVVNKQATSGNYSNNENSSGQQPGKKRGKKSAGQQANTNILGFRPAGDPNRMNVGEIDLPM